MYNEPHAAVAGKKHPSLMGSVLEQAWPEVIHDVEPVFASAESLGRATMMENTPLFLERQGFVEETYFTYSYIPIRDELGNTHGFYNTAFETTRQVLWQRRMSM